MRRLVVLCLLVGAAACARRAVPPRTLVAPPTSAAPRQLAVQLASFEIFGLGRRDGPAAERRLRDVFITHLWDATRLRWLATPERESPPDDALVMDVQIALEQTDAHTIVLDVLSALPTPLFGLITPWAGWVEGSLKMTVRDAKGVVVLEELVEADVAMKSQLAYGWFAIRFVEDTYREVYSRLFTQAVERFLARQSDIVLALQLAPPRHAPPVDVVSGSVAAAAATSAVAPAVSSPPPLPLATAPAERLAAHEWRKEAQELRVFREPLPVRGGPVARALSSIGGVEASYIYGFARVASRARGESGAPVEIAAGAATQRGYKIALYSAPKTTGWFVAPTLGYLSQRIEIADFRETLPAAEVDGGEDIEARCSDPASGEEIDCAAPNIYALDMQSVFGGLRAGYDLAVGTGKIVFFASASVGANVLEYRTVAARISSYRSSGSDLEVLKSFAAGGTIGLRFPRLYSSVRLIGDYEMYRDFDYAEPLEFKGQVAYNADKNIYERARTFVGGASLTSWSWQCAYALAF